MILIISGTNRINSNSLRLAKYYEKEIQKKGEECEILSLTELPSDLISTDLYGKRSEAFAAIQERISSCRKFIFIAAEYNGSIPGVLKIFIDACAFPASFYHKKAALVGISSGKYGNIRGIDHLTGICNYLRLHILPLKIHIPSIQQELSLDAELLKEDTKNFVQEQIDEFIAF